MVNFENRFNQNFLKGILFGNDRDDDWKDQFEKASAKDSKAENEWEQSGSESKMR